MTKMLMGMGLSGGHLKQTIHSGHLMLMGMGLSGGHLKQTTLHLALPEAPRAHAAAAQPCAHSFFRGHLSFPEKAQDGKGGDPQRRAVVTHTLPSHLSSSPCHRSSSSGSSSCSQSSACERSMRVQQLHCRASPSYPKGPPPATGHHHQAAHAAPDPRPMHATHTGTHTAAA